MTTRVLAVVGPTGTGKSAVAVELAARLGGEVVNADSMQLYRSMDIGTAKLSVDERAGIPHHLLDVWDVTEAADVVRYQQQARACIDEIASRGRVPVLVGGSGLYVRAVLDDLDFPGTDPEVRGRLEAELIDLGPAALHARLAAVDPAAAAAILPSNGRRLVRALEVVAIRGSFTATLPPPSPIYDAFQLALDRPDLDDRLRRRVRQMFEGGLVDEVRRLECIGLREGRTASRALGYAQVLRARDAVARGAELGSELARAEADTVTATRRFARRQRSWFRRDASVRWLTALNSSDEFMSEAVTTMEQWWNVSPPRRS
ncbi:MAG: tRNA dimethylallyltransferase [Frankiaceae bacterium]|nr:tRNA dimethylallyltransferase [Frankiaceae bacterium]